MEGMDPDRQYVGSVSTALLSIYLLVILALSVVILTAVWPTPGRPIIQTQLDNISTEGRYLLLVISSGALGSSLHALRSLIDYVGNRQLVKRWIPWYLLRVFVAVPLTIFSYFVIRALMFPTGEDINGMNPFGIAVSSILVGMFANPITHNLLRLTQSLVAQQTRLEKDIDRIGAILGVTSLDNYQGYICVTFQDEQGVPVLPRGAGSLDLQAGKDYQMVAWFQSSEATEGFKEKIKIDGGVDAEDVEFVLSADSERVSLRPRQAVISFSVKKRSPAVNFKFTVPEGIDSFEIWIQITQKNQFINLISTLISVRP